MKKTFSIIGILSGIALIILGVMLLTKEFSYSFNRPLIEYTFGADFYTEIYDATFDAANSLYSIGHLLADIADFVANGFWYLLLALGLFDICFFCTRMEDTSAGTVEAIDSKLYTIQDIIKKMPANSDAPKEEIKASDNEELPDL